MVSTAGIIIIGDEILSGRTKDTNINWIATELNNIKSIYESLHPKGIDQERYLNFGNFYSFKGQELIDYIIDKVPISDDKILVINLED